jgi:hypothetical protein
MHPDDIPKARFGIFEFLLFHFDLRLQDHVAIAGPDSSQPELHVQTALHGLPSQGALPSPAGSCPWMHLCTPKLVNAGVKVWGVPVAASTMIVRFVILLWRGFIHVKIHEWNVNKTATSLRLRSKGGLVPPSVLC